MENNGYPKTNFTALKTCFLNGFSGLRKVLLGFLIAISLTACMTAAIPASDQTSLPQASETPVQIETPTKEFTPTTTNTATPTATEIPPLALAEFSAELKGKGVHGGMVCFTYAGDASDLDGLTLSAFTYRDGNLIEQSGPPEQIEGESCFEITDANYISVTSTAEGGRIVIPDEPISVKIRAYSESKELSNNAQTIDLGKYVQFPFLQWIYPEVVSDVCIENVHNWDGVKYTAWDFVPKLTKDYPTIVGTPVLAPVDGIAFVRINLRAGESVPNVAFDIFSYDTGYLVNLTHNYELVPQDGKWVMISEFQAKDVSAGEQVGIIGPKDYMSGMPHTHLQIIIPTEKLDLSKDSVELNRTIHGYFTKTPMNDIDPVKEGLFLNEDIQSTLENKSITAAPCNYSWGEVVIPQQLPFTIDGEADDWAAYQPVLTDETGDSEAGNVMDLSELYMAKDDNYLYLMLKAGEKPSGEWAVGILMDFYVNNKCGNSERLIDIWTQFPGTFSIGSIDDCEDSSGGRYPGEYIWSGDVFEAKIALAYLANPPDAKAIEAKGVLLDSQDQITFLDYMD